MKLENTKQCKMCAYIERWGKDKDEKKEIHTILFVHNIFSFLQRVRRERGKNVGGFVAMQVEIYISVGVESDRVNEWVSQCFALVTVLCENVNFKTKEIRIALGLQSFLWEHREHGKLLISRVAFLPAKYIQKRKKKNSVWLVKWKNTNHKKKKEKKLKQVQVHIWHRLWKVWN